MQENRQEKSQIKRNISLYLHKKGVSDYEFYKKSGITRGILSQPNGISEDNISRFLAYAPDVNVVWLLTGEGEMFKTSEGMPHVAHQTENPKEGIPLIPLDAMAGYFEGEMQVLLRDCERYIVPGMPRADFLITVKGDSMMPSYFPGDIVACVRVPIKDVFFQFGRVYVLDTNQGAIIKRIEKSEDEDSILIVSDNEKYSPFTLHLSQVRSIALVIGLIRLE